uniref:DNA-binding protein SMUBP-2 n=1 Tax=Plectus sambesii TaxID=2011161 RepID=A0A914XNP2_9BILA
VLLCAPSNVAVDNVVERLGPHVNLIRMGHPARSHSSLVKYSFDAALDASDHAPVLKDIRGELRGLEASAGPFAERRMHQLRAELRKREKKATQDVLKSTDVVCSTLITASNSLLTGLKFDLVVIDECAQSTELACWIGLLQGRRCVLAGDHCQLPPTIISEEAAREGLSISLMDRLSSDFADLADPFFRLLSIQYRMNDAIMKWASDGFYEGRLISDVSVAQHSLKDLSKSEFDDDICEEKVCIIDTNGCDMPELSTESDESKGNLGEAKIAYVQVKRLIDAGIAENVIAVISPYNLQVQFLRSCIGRDFPKVAIRSVDGFQGQEREALVLSLVRSNDQGVVGFLSDKRRINVAVTRARRHLCVICDTETVSNEPVIKSLVDYITDKGMVRSALEYDQDELDAVNLEIDTDDLQLPASDTKKPQAQKQQQPTTASSKQPKYGSRPSRKEAASYSLDATVKNPKEGLSATSLEGEHPSDWKVELTAQVDWFEMASTESTLTFPSNLSASQRRFLHEIADSRGLAHSSVGEGDQRQIVLEKKRPVNDVPVVVHNPPLRPVKDEREKTETAPSKSAKKTTTKKSRNVADAEEHYDVNELIAEIVDKESRCSFGHCSRSVGMLGVLCNYCRRRFCLTHAQAEIHGCGTLAQAEAKKQFRHQMSSGAPSQQKKLTGPNRDYVQRKLDDKLKKMQDERASGKKK